MNKKSVIKGKTENYKIVAYVHGRQDSWGENNEKANQVTHINYAFANIKDGKVIEGNENDAEALQKLNQLKLTNKNLKILISVGGWSWSKNFSDAVLNKNSRQKFANSAINFVIKHKIDGVDLDWEYPGQIGDNNRFRPEDKENFTAILQLLRKKLDSLASGKKTYLLTVATGANQSYLDHTDMRKAQKYLDYINIMTYDFVTGGSNGTGHHSNLEESRFDSETFKKSSRNSVQEHILAGIPSRKIVLGVPFYGRYWKGVNPKNHGLYQLAKGQTGGYGYKAIADSINSKVFTPYWDDSAKAPYIWRDKDSLFITYGNTKSMQYKVDFVKKEKLGGVMFWQFSGDNGDLLKTLSDHLKKDN
ncbi:glycoside hydrolase family 18 protein [Gaetbulibacter sp. M235]|uniref:glycoside hydrolase family 18 protein n=1 Tax=Gaetbulibacter sp. M235 TaxID=3126510 RepID=UPI00374F0FC9